MEVSEPLMDCNFPELLAVDLSRSEDVFLAKHLTAGAPVPSLASDGSQRRYSLQDSSPRYLSPEPRGASSRMKSLQAADQRYSQLFSGGYDETREISDSETSNRSSQTSSSSGGLEPPPSISARDVSVTTTATSVTSGRDSSRSIYKSPLPIENSPGESWMNLDFEEKPTPERRHSLSLSSPPQLPPLPRLEDDDFRAMSLGSRVPRSGFSNPMTPERTPSRMNTTPAATTASPSSAAYARRIVQTNNFPKRRSSLIYQDHHSSFGFAFSPRCPPSPSHFIVKSTPQSTPPSRPATRSAKDYEPATPENVRVEARSESSSDSDTKVEDYMQSPAKSVEDTGPVIASPLLNVERWLDSSIEMGFSQQQLSADNTASRMRIPPEVLDTLRVSVSCFPETMLLCSSLSIENLRSHARKFKYRAMTPSSESQASLLLPDGSPRPSRWKWLTGTSKKPADQTPAKLQSRRLFETPSLTTGDADWSVLRNIFPSGTDYLCDGLYAHILAYNYITSVCPRLGICTPSNTNISRPVSKASTVTSIASKPNISDSNKIPRKAASLLGLQNDPYEIDDSEPPSPGRTNTLRSKSSFVKGKRADTPRLFTPVSSRSTDNYDQTLRDLRLGLAKCIARLVATLRSAAGEFGEKPSPLADGKEIDPVFIRALCEVVRCSEEQ